MVALRNHKRWDVLRHTGASADHHVCTNDAELMDCGHAANNCEIIYRYVSCQRCVVGKNTAVTYRTVVRDMRINHKQVVAAHLRQSTTLYCSTMNGDAFANAVTIADFQTGRLTSIFKILVYFADGSELIDLVIAANSRMTIHDNVRFQYCTLTNFDMGSNNTKWANMDVSTNNGTDFHNGGRMNKGGFINHVSRLPATSTHHSRFANNFAVNQSYAFEASQAATRFFKSDFHDHLITRHDRTLEARFIDT